MCESGLVLGEISFMRKHLKKFAKPCRVRTPLAQFAAKSFITPEPYGNTLIMSPWNYPILLTLEPLVDTVAAGNTAILKPSAYAPASSEILQKIVSECFSPEYVAVVTGGARGELRFAWAKIRTYLFYRQSKCRTRSASTSGRKSHAGYFRVRR